MGEINAMCDPVNAGSTPTVAGTEFKLELVSTYLQNGVDLIQAQAV